MRLLIRCDASPTLGIGHAMRCIALAERAEASLFAMTTGMAVVSAHGHSCEAVGSDPIGFLALAKKWRADWIVVDIASADGLIRMCADLSAPILRIDDGGLTAQSNAALVLNPNVGITSDDYPGQDPQRLLLGPSYALLRKTFSGAKRQLNGSPRIFVGFGGSDPPNFTQRVVGALTELSDCKIDAILGPENLNKSAIFECAERVSNIEIHVNPPNLAELMARADIAVTSASGMMWELMAIGAPVIALAIAPNQRRNLAWLAANEVGRAIGWYADVDDATIINAVREYLSDVGLRILMAERGRKLVDGFGADRAIEKMKTATKLTA